MKELSIEEKAKRYDEALERIKKYTKDEYGCTRLKPEDIFPELKESEDERIRKWLIHYFKEVCDNVSEKEKKGVIDWLEKHGVQKPQRMISAGAKEAMYNKPACVWSEEDEHNMQNIDSILFHDKTLPEDTCVKLRDFLKSLKERYTWKPSEEQMKALHDLNLTGNISYAGQGQVLIELYNNLKKLKGE